MGFNLNRAADALVTGTQTQATAVSIRQAVQIDDRFLRIVATASASATPEQIAEGVRQQFKGAAIMPGSFVSLSSSKAQHVFEGIVGVIQKRVVLTEDNKAAYTAIAANMFMSNDESKTLWALRKTENGQVLVKAMDSEADHATMKYIMACASTNLNDFDNRDVGAENAQIRAAVEGGDLVAYISQQSADLQMGIATASLDNEDGSPTHEIHVVRANGQQETINREMIVVAADIELESEDNEGMEALASSTVDLSRISAYYSRVFARRPAYFELFMQRVRGHVFM